MSSLRILKSNPRNPPETVTWRPTDSAVPLGAQSAVVSHDLHIILYKYILCKILSVQVEKITITSLKPVYGYHNLLSCRQQFSRTLNLNKINSNEHKILQQQYGCLFELTPHLQHPPTTDQTGHLKGFAMVPVNLKPSNPPFSTSTHVAAPRSSAMLWPRKLCKKSSFGQRETCK